MNWFYAHQGQRAGPVDDAELARLVSAGTVGDTTLVWRSGMSDWMPYAQARATVPAAAPGAPPGSHNGAFQAQCSQCGRVFPTDEVIRLEGFNVCAECKPLLLQKMRQGMSPAYGAYGVVSVVYGGFWIRVVAAILDAIIMTPVVLLLYFTAIYFYPQLVRILFNPDQDLATRLIIQGVGFVIGASYDVFLTGRFGGTAGKLICGLRVVRADGTPVTYARAFGRYAAKSLNALTLLIGVVMVAFDSQKRALHDYLAGTRVVYK